MFRNVRLHKAISALFILSTLAWTSCGTPSGKSNGSNTSETAVADSAKIPHFNSSLAYQLIQKQVDFGPRVPGTKAHKDCAAWLYAQLKPYCDTVYKQDTFVTAGNGKKLPCINLIGVIRPKATQRVLLLAHWDSRPWADEDTVNKNKPILGADDGGSGVAVLLTLSRILQKNALPKNWGVDILLTDVEDYGKTKWGDNSYALGTQLWAHHPHVPHYHARAGILLDMVGGKNAHFPLEAYSAQHASYVQKQVWRAASAAGYSSFFVFEQGPQITDDHVPVNKILKIPTVDIINLPAGSPTGFASYWHTHRDNMSIIDKNTLQAVGQTLLQYLYTR